MTLILIAILPSAVGLSPGETTQLSAVGWHADGTSQDLTSTVAWVSSTPGVATVSIGGLVTAVAIGSTRITASNASPALIDACVADVVAPATECWDGAPTPVEARLSAALPAYALECLRQRMLHVATTARSPRKGARVLLQMTGETELRAIVAKMVPLPPGIAASIVCERRRFVEIDADMRPTRFLVGPALVDLEGIREIPPAYVDLLRRYASSRSPRHRVCALATTLVLAAAVTP